MAALGYDSAKILADAINRAGTTDGPKLRDAIAATKDFKGVTGKITLDADRNAKKAAVILTIANGGFQFVSASALGTRSKLRESRRACEPKNHEADLSTAMIEFLQQLINGLSLGAIYALIALGYTMVYGVLRFINFAHGDVFMVGAFAGLYLAPLVMRLFATGLPGRRFLVLLVAMAVCAILGIVIEKLAYRPLRNRPRLTVLITAIGVSLFLENFGQYVFGVDPQSFPDLIGDHAITIPAWCGPLTDLTIMVSRCSYSA